MKKKCPKCGLRKENNKENFYIRPDRNGKTQSYCKECNKQLTLERQRKLKQKLVDLKGGQCKNCGYNGHIAAFDFHHRDPSQKDFEFSKYRGTSFENNKGKILAELDKCDMLCKNCHAIEHAGY